jgi:hypothetical protein
MDEIDFAVMANINLGDELTAIVPSSSLELSAEEAAKPEGLSPAGQQLSIAFADPATLTGPSSGVGSSARKRKGNGSGSEPKSPGGGVGFLKALGGVQKKITRGKALWQTQ